jgi:hypothetical protein
MGNWWRSCHCWMLDDSQVCFVLPCCPSPKLDSFCTQCPRD